MQQIPELLFVALDHYRYPSPYDEQRASAPLPPGITSLLASPQNCLSDEHVADTAAALAVSEKDCRAALLRYIQLLLFDAPQDHYRVLGVERSASQELIRQHYDYLDQLLRAEWQADHDDWAARHENKVEQAYTVLGNPASRVEYDVARAGAGMVLVKSADKPEPTDAPAAPLAQQLEAIATPRAAPVEETTPPADAEAKPVSAPHTPSELEPKPKAEAESGAQTNAAEQQPPATAESPEPAVAAAEPASEQPAHPRRRSRVLVFATLAAVLLLGVYFNQQRVVTPSVEPGSPAVSERDATASAAATAAGAPQPAAQSGSETSGTDAADAAGKAVTPGSQVDSPAEPAPISDAELAELEQAFTKHYDAGDAADFAGLFAENAQTSVARGREAIERYYAGIFANLRLQQLRLNTVQWQPGDARRTGSASVSITAAPAGRGRPVTLANTLQFEVARNGTGTIEIVQLEH